MGVTQPRRGWKSDVRPVHPGLRPRADYLRDGVYELRTDVRGVNYRILYGFVGQDAALVVCGLTKEGVGGPHRQSAAGHFPARKRRLQGSLADHARTDCRGP